MSLGRTAARGAAVSFGAQAVTAILQFASVIILARLLSPSDFGLFAMVTVIVGLGEILRDSGLSSAAIQAKSVSVSERSALFWANTGIGGALMLIVAGLAVPLSALYGEPALARLVVAVAPLFLVNGAKTQYRASLSRALKFRELAIADVAAAAVGLAAGLLVAYLGAGYWALVAQQFVVAVVGFVAMVSLEPWLPRMPERGTSIKRFVHFGWRVLVTQAIDYTAKNLDTFVVGVRHGASLLGFYSRAYQLVMRPLNMIRPPSTAVALPVLSRMNEDNEQARFNHFLTTGQVVLGLPVAIAMGIVVGAGDPIVRVLLGDDWAQSATFLRVFALGGMFQTLSYVGYWVSMARGKSDVLLRYTVVSTVVRVLCILVGSFWGAYGVGAGFALGFAIEWPISLAILGRHTPVPTRRLYGNAARILAYFTVVAASVYGAVRMISGSPFLTSILASGVGVISAVVISALVPALRRDAVALVTVVRMVRRRADHNKGV